LLSSAVNISVIFSAFPGLLDEIVDLLYFDTNLMMVDELKFPYFSQL